MTQTQRSAKNSKSRHGNSIRARIIGGGLVGGEVAIEIMAAEHFFTPMSTFLVDCTAASPIIMITCVMRDQLALGGLLLHSAGFAGSVAALWATIAYAMKERFVVLKVSSTSQKSMEKETTP